MSLKQTEAVKTLKLQNSKKSPGSGHFPLDNFPWTIPPGHLPTDNFPTLS